MAIIIIAVFSYRQKHNNTDKTENNGYKISSKINDYNKTYWHHSIVITLLIISMLFPFLIVEYNGLVA